MAVQTLLVDITEEECEDLLEIATLGRLGVIVDGHPEIFPVSHVFDRQSGCVAFPTNERTKLHAALSWPWVAFEVDGLEPDDSGWSVLVVGAATEMTDPVEVSRVSALRRTRWAAGPGRRWVRINPSKVTGRRIRSWAPATAEAASEQR